MNAFLGARLARALHDRLPDWLTQPAGVGRTDMVDPAGVWHLSIDPAGVVDLDRRGEPAGVLRDPDPGALAAFLTTATTRERAGVSRR